MKDLGLLALIVAGPGRWREAAEAQWKALKPIAWVEYAEDERSALKVFTEHLTTTAALLPARPQGQPEGVAERERRRRAHSPRPIALSATDIARRYTMPFDV